MCTAVTMKRQAITKNVAAIVVMLTLAQASAVQQSLASFVCRTEDRLIGFARPALVAVATFTGNHELYVRATRSCPGTASAAAAPASFATVATEPVASV